MMIGKVAIKLNGVFDPPIRLGSPAGVQNLCRGNLRRYLHHDDTPNSPWR